MTVKRTNSEAGQKPSPRLRLEPELKIATAVFSKEVVLQLVDQWIAPALAEEFLRSKMNLLESIRREHNEDHL